MSIYEQKSVKAEKASIWLAAPLQDLLDISEVSPDENCVDGAEKSARDDQGISLSRRLNRYSERSLWALRADPPVLSRLAWDLIFSCFDGRTEIEAFDLQTLPDRVRDFFRVADEDTFKRLEPALDEIAGLRPMQRVAAIMVTELFFSDEHVSSIGQGDMRLAISVVTHLPASACFRDDVPLPQQWRVTSVGADPELAAPGQTRVRLENPIDQDEITVSIERHATGFSAFSPDFAEFDPVRFGQHDPRELLGKMAAQAVADLHAQVEQPEPGSADT